MMLTDSPKALAGLVIDCLSLYAQASHLLIWLSSADLSKPVEYASVLRQIRIGAGETRDTVLVPGHLIPRSEPGLAGGLILLALLARWEVILAAEHQSILTFISAKGVLFLVGGSQETLDEAFSKLSHSLSDRIRTLPQ